MSGQDGLTNGDGLFGVLLGVVVFGSDIDPVGVGFTDVGFAGNLPAVLIGDGRLRVVPHILDGIRFHVLAALGQALSQHIHQHLAQNFGGALRDHQAAGIAGDIAVPGGDGQACGHGFLHDVIKTRRVNGRHADGIGAAVDGILDNSDLVGNRGFGVAVIGDGETLLGSILLRAVIGGLEESVTGQLGHKHDVDVCGHRH